jgi:hypothetical protein
MKPNVLLSGFAACGLWAANAHAQSNAPTILCPQPVVSECASSNTGWLVLTATVEDIDGDAMTAVWWVNGQTVLTNDVPASAPTNTATLSLTNVYALGTNLVTLTVTDGNTDPVTCGTTVVIQDTTAPVILRVAASPKTLWPPNHKMVQVQFRAITADACDPNPKCKILSIRSNEPIDGKGDGNTSPDWARAGKMAAYLRAERSGRGNGRTYTVTIECRDASGNATTKDVRVFVPHDQGH